MLFGKIGGIYEWTTVAQTISGFNTTTTFNTSRNTTTTFSTSRSTTRNTNFNTNRATTTSFNTTTTFVTSSPVTFLANTVLSSVKDSIYYGFENNVSNVVFYWNFSVVTTINTSDLNEFAASDGYTYVKETFQYRDDAGVITDYYSISRNRNTTRSTLTNRNTTTTFSTSRLTTATTTFNTTKTTNTVFSTSRTTTTGSLKNTDRVTRYYQ